MKINMKGLNPFGRVKYLVTQASWKVHGCGTTARNSNPRSLIRFVNNIVLHTLAARETCRVLYV